MRLRLAALALALLSWASTAWAAPAPTLCQTEQDAGNLTVYTLDSCTVSAGTLVLLTVLSVDGSTPGVPAIGGTLGLSWTSVVGVTGSTSRLHAFCALGGAGATGTVTVDYAGVGDAQNRFTGILTEFSGADVSGACTAALVQTPTYPATAETGPSTLTFASYSNSNNRPYVVFGKLIEATADFSADSWSELADVATTGEALMQAAAWRNDTTDTTATVAFSPSTSATTVGIGFEVKAAAGGTPCVIGGGIVVTGCVN